MALLEKINNIDATTNIDIAKIKKLLEKNYGFQKRFTSEIDKFLVEYKNVSIEKSIANDLVTIDGMLFLKDLVEINYSFCFDDFDEKTLSLLPLFFISFEKNEDSQNLERIIPSICNFSNEIETFLKTHNLNYGGHIVFGEKRLVSSRLEVGRFVSFEEFEKIIVDAEILLNRNLPLFIEDLENFVLNKAFSLVIPETNREINKRILFLNEAIINVENYLSELNENDSERDNLNDIIDSLEILKKKEI